MGSRTVQSGVTGQPTGGHHYNADTDPKTPSLTLSGALDSVGSGLKATGQGVAITMRLGGAVAAIAGGILVAAGLSHGVLHLFHAAGMTDHAFNVYICGAIACAGGMALMSFSKPFVPRDLQ